MVHNASNELLEKPLVSKLFEQYADILFLGAAMKKYKNAQFFRKPTVLKICLGKT